jgi:hypothetical protein
MPKLKRHKCRAPVAFHAFMNTRCGGANPVSQDNATLIPGLTWTP